MFWFVFKEEKLRRQTDKETKLRKLSLNECPVKGLPRINYKYLICSIKWDEMNMNSRIFHQIHPWCIRLNPLM